MKIGIDARLWNESGVGRYIRNLVINLGKIDKKNSYVLFVREIDREEVQGRVGENFTIVSFNSRWHSVSEQINFPKVIEKQKVDLMHFPYYSMPVFYRSPYVLTIHDLILHHFPTGKASTLPFWLYGFKMLSYRFVINNAAWNAKKVIAVSNFTKDDVIDHLRVHKRDVEVIYEGADDFKTSSSEKVEYKNYFLYVGNVYPHKNAERLIKAFEIFLRKHPDYNLVFAGRNDVFYERLRKSNKKLVNSGKIFFDYDSGDEKIVALYQNAIALIRPSLMEGFSLPPLEAMESSCLVLGSDISVHREIFGDSMIYFEPKDIPGIAAKMEKLINMNEKSRKELIEKGLRTATKFSWEKTARQTLAVYESSTSTDSV